jgi:hypothetical protein
VAANRNRPRQASLHRATSTIYYAVFHTLVRSCADMLVGTVGSQRSGPAWRQVYRAPLHDFVRTRCANTAMMSKFPKGIQDFAYMFATMQIKRHEADYAPDARALKSEVIADIDASEAAIEGFENVAAKDRRAFAVWVLLKDRKS